MAQRQLLVGQVVPHVCKQAFAHRSCLRITPQIDMLKRVVREVVELTVTCFIHRTGQCCSADPVITTNRAQMNNFAEQHTVPFGEYAFMPKCLGIAIGVWQARRFDVTGLFKSGNVGKCCSQ